MYAYDYNLFNKAQTSLGWMFDYAVLDCGLTLRDYYSRFLISDISKRFEKGDSSVIAGMSGIELAMRVIEDSDGTVILPEPSYMLRRSREYWLGWSLAYYQWVSNIPFGKITENVSIDEIYSMYDKYHELDIRHFADRLDEMRCEAKKESSLKRYRKYAGLSQGELAKVTGIPLKTIQAYEQMQKNINNAGVDYIIKLSRALNCDMEMLLEK